MFEQVYAHEQQITRKTNGLGHLASTEPDYATLKFLQGYAAGQHQKEFLFKGILDKIQLIGTEGQGLFFIDRELGRLATRRAQGSTVEGFGPNAGDRHRL